MRKLLPLLLLAALLLSACSSAPADSVSVWRVSAEGMRSVRDPLCAEVRKIPAGADPISSAVDMFNSPPLNPDLLSPMGGARITGFSTDGSCLRLEVSKEFLELGPAQSACACCCMALTFCAFDGADKISVWFEDREIRSPMSPDDIILADNTAQ